MCRGMYLNIYVMLRTMFPVLVELSQDDYFNVICLNQPKCKKFTHNYALWRD